MTEQEQPNNAVLAVKLDYISKDITAIKSDIKDIKNDSISRREFTTYTDEIQAILEDQETRLRENTEFRNNLKGKYAVLAILGMLAIGIISSVVSTNLNKKINSECPNIFTCTLK